MTKFLRIACAVALVMAGLSAVAEPKGPEYAVVTWAGDGTERADGKITLRDAIGAMADPAFTNAAGARVITFSLGEVSNVTLNAQLNVASGTKPFAIDGLNGGRGVTLSGATRLVRHDGDGLTLSNLTFRGGNAGAENGGAILVTASETTTNRTLTAVNCAFDGNAAQSGGAVAAEAKTHLVFDRCTFFGNTGSEAGAVLAGGSLVLADTSVLSNRSGSAALFVRGEGVVAKSTLAFNAGTGGALHVAGGATCGVSDSLFSFNGMDVEQLCDVQNEGTLNLHGVKMLSGVIGGGGLNKGNHTTIGEAAYPLFAEFANEGFDIYAVSRAKDGVTHRVFLPLHVTNVVEGAGCLWHDEAWTNVAFSADASGDGKTALCGDAALCGIRAALDVLGRAPEKPARGAVQGDFHTMVTFEGGSENPSPRSLPCGGAPGEGPVVPALSGLPFDGWFERLPDGTKKKWWNGDGTPAIGEVPSSGQVTLSASYVATEETFVVTSETDDSSTEGTVTLRSAIAAMAAAPDWIGADGRRAITFSPVVTNISLQLPLTVPPGTRSFLIDGGPDGKLLTSIVGSRILSLENEGVSLSRLVFASGNAAATDAVGAGGGAIWATNECAVAASNCVFRNNRAATYGGAVRLVGSGSAAFVGCTFYANELAEGSGGAICAEGATLTLEDCSFVKNACTGAASSGGAVSGYGPLAVTRCTFYGNRAGNAGSVLSMGTVSVRDSLFAANEPPSSGAFADLPAEDLFAPPNEEIVLDGMVLTHAYLRPLVSPDVTNGVVTTAPVDLLGRAPVLSGKGAVRSEFGVRLDLDTAGGSMTVTNVRFAVCGVAPPPLPVPERVGYEFVGWWGDLGNGLVQCADKEGEPIAGIVLPYVGEIALYARWNSGAKRFVVTSLADDEGSADTVTLRSAIREMAASSGGDRKITFAVSGTVQLKSALEMPVGAERIVVDGLVQGGVTVQGGGFSGVPLFQVKGAGLDLCNLTVEGASDGVARVASGGTFAASNCVFRSNEAEQGGVAHVEGTSASPTSRFTRCTFKGNVSRTAGSGVAFAQSPLAFEACSFVDAGDTVFGEGPMTFDRCTLASVPGGTGSATLNDTLAFAGSEENFVPGEQMFAVGPVTHVYRRPLPRPAVTNGLSSAYGELPDLTGRAAAADGSRLIPGRGAVHSEYGTLLAFDAGGGAVAETNLYALCGAHPTETAPVPSRFGFDFGGWYLTEDFTGEPCFGVDGQPNPAAEPLPFRSPLALYAKWAATPALLTVTSGGDEHVDGQVNLREAVEALAKYDFADRTIRFDGVAEIRLKEQIVVPEGTAPFTIDGGASGLTLKPDDSSVVRLINHLGQGLTLRNMTLRDVVGSGGGEYGVGIHAEGSLVAENCAFVKCGNGGGNNTVIDVWHSTAILVDCTFADNEMGASDCGVALTVSSDASAVAVHCTFCQNRIQSKTCGAVSNQGKLTLLGCSVVDNVPYGIRAAAGSTVLAGCALALNPTNDVSGSVSKIERTSSVQYGSELGNILKDGNRAVAQKAVVNGVEHTYYVPSGSDEMRAGVYIWHDAAWANVAYSTELVRSAGNTTVVLGSYDAANTLKSTDQIGTPLAEPYRGAVGLVQEIGENGLLVTTCDDVVDPTDGVLSLREALAVAEGRRIDPDLDGRYRIRFADSLFDASGRATVLFTHDVQTQVKESDILICGQTDGRRLTLDCRGRSVRDAFTVADGGALELDDLTVLFSPKSSDSTAFFVYSYGTFTLAGCTVERSSQSAGRQMITVTGGLSTLERCSFVGGAGANETGGGVAAAGGEVRILGCTFANLNLANPGVIEKSVNGRLVLANTTLVGNTVQNDRGVLSIAENAGGEMLVLNCLFANEVTDIFYPKPVVPPSFKLCQTVCKAVSNPLKNAMTGCTLMGAAAANAFASDLRRLFVGGVERAYRPPRLRGQADRTGGYVWRSEDWQTLAVTSNYVNRLNRIQVSGNSNDVAKASILVGATDIVGRDVLQGINVRDIATDRQATPGSYATTEDAEVDAPGWLTVNTLTDENSAEPDRYDGHLSLREAVDYAQRHPEWRTNGLCTVTFDPKVFELKHDQVAESRMRQIDITTFTNGTLRIAGPADGTNSVTLSGMGKYRLFHVGAGNRVEFSNLNFTNALSQSGGACPTFAGGAIHNAGEITVSNCSFRACRTKAQGYAYGGAIFTAQNGRATVERCSFVGCKAGEGGAVCTDEGGTTVLATSVFTGNSVTRLTTLCDGTGGAVCGRRGAAMTALVNCTVTGNAAEGGGGGVAVCGSSATQTALYLLDSIVVGNVTDGADGSADIRVAVGKADLRHTWCGGRNDTLDERWDIDDTVKADRVPSDIFCDIAENGAALPKDVRSGGAAQTYFRLVSEKDLGAAFVKTYDGWKNVGYAAGSPTDTPIALYLEAASREIQLRRSGVLRGTDQFGNEIGAKALMGATAVYDKSQEPVPVVETDPLCVSNATFGALSDVIRYAATHTGDASLVSNGYLTVTFASPNYTFNFDTDLELKEFTGPKLRIVGPVTFAGGDKTRFFSVLEGNGLRLENVTMVNGFSAGTNEVNNGLGGAIYAEYATLSASNCTFRSCVAKSPDGSDGFGGAVMAFGSPADFTTCTFEGCRADEEVGGTCVSRMDCDATFVGCTFVGSGDETLKQEVYDPLHALVIRADPAGRRDYFSTVAEALGRCLKGDTLVLLAPDAVDVPEVAARLPRGVTLRIGGAADGAEALLTGIAEAANADFAKKGESWYTATVREADGLVVMDVGLNDQAKPGIDGDAEVDFNAEDGTAVSVWPTNVKPGLIYGLGRSESPTGPFVVEADGWVQAGADSKLPRALTAPKGDGAGCFYRVFVR